MACCFVRFLLVGCPEARNARSRAFLSCFPAAASRAGPREYVERGVWAPRSSSVYHTGPRLRKCIWRQACEITLPNDGKAYKRAMADCSHVPRYRSREVIPKHTSYHARS